MTSQLGSIITNPDYAEALGISPVLKPEQIKAVVLDDAPLVYDKFSLGTKVLVTIRPIPIGNHTATIGNIFCFIGNLSEILDGISDRWYIISDRRY